MSPIFSVIIPTYNTRIKWLEEAIASVDNQLCQEFEVCIHDDGSYDDALLQYLHELANQPRFSVSFGNENLGIAHATNEAISLASGQYVCFLDHDDLLNPQALSAVKDSIDAQPDADWLYTDEQVVHPDGQTIIEVIRKPHFSPTLLLSHNYICHLLIVKKSAGDALGWMRPGYEGSQDHDLILRLLKNSNPVHIPKVLYSWRMNISSVQSGFSKNNAVQSRKRAVENWMHSNNLQGEMIQDNNGRCRLTPKIDEDQVVSILIPYKDRFNLTNKCLKSIFSRTHWENVEVLLINNSSNDEAGLNAFLDQWQDSRIRHVNFPEEPFNYSRLMNFAAEKAKGKFLLLLNNDTEVATSGWIRMLLEALHLPKVGFVGCTLLNPNDTIQQCGISVGTFGAVRMLFRDQDPLTLRRQSRLFLPHDVSACSAACMLTSKEVWNALGGLDEITFPVAYNDVDYCMKAHDALYNGVVHPLVYVYHEESASRKEFNESDEGVLFDREQRTAFANRWRKRIQKGDRFVSSKMAPMLIGDSSTLDGIAQPAPTIIEQFFYPEAQMRVVGEISPDWSAALLFGLEGTGLSVIRDALLNVKNTTLIKMQFEALQSIKEDDYSPFSEFISNCVAKPQKGLCPLWGSHMLLPKMLKAVEDFKDRLIILCPSFDLIEQLYSGDFDGNLAEEFLGRQIYLTQMLEIPVFAAEHGVATITYSSKDVTPDILDTFFKEVLWPGLV